MLRLGSFLVCLWVTAAGAQTLIPLGGGGGAPSTITIPTTTTGCATANGVFFNSSNTIACAPSVILTGAGAGVSAVNEFLINSAGAAPFRVVNRSRLYSPADGIWRMSNNADAGFTSLNFGLLTTAWPMLKIVGPTIQVRLGDDSGAAALTASTLSTSGFTVGTLPAGTIGMRAYVTDQLTTCAAIGAVLTGGGAVVCPVFYNGSAWVGG